MARRKMIKSLWNVDPCDLTEKNIVYLLQHPIVSAVINKTVKSLYFRYKDYFKVDELKCAAREGAWKAIKTHDPGRGELIQHMSYVCRAYVNRYIETGLRRNKYEQNFGDNVYYVYNNSDEISDEILNSITVNKILDQMKNKDRNLLERHYLMNYKIKDSMTINRLKYKLYKKRLEKALHHAREISDK